VLYRRRINDAKKGGADSIYLFQSRTILEGDRLSNYSGGAIKGWWATLIRYIDHFNSQAKIDKYPSAQVKGESSRLIRSRLLTDAWIRVGPDLDTSLNSFTKQ